MRKTSRVAAADCSPGLQPGVEFRLDVECCRDDRSMGSVAPTALVQALDRQPRAKARGYRNIAALRLKTGALRAIFLTLALIGIPTTALAQQPAEKQTETPPAKTETEQKPADATQSKAQDESKLTNVQGGKALGMSILGNQEAPKALVIVPWKSSELGSGPSVSTQLDDSKLPIDKEVFMRMLSYYQIRSETAHPSGASSNGNIETPANAAPRRKP